VKQHSTPGTHHRLMPRLARLGAALAAVVLLAAPAGAQQVIIDYNTNTSLAVTGDNTTIKTTTISGGVAFNSFEKFDVYSGKVVNLVQPSSASCLINLVTGGQPSAFGGDPSAPSAYSLNGIQNNQVGGDIYMVNPAGVSLPFSHFNNGIYNVIQTVNNLQVGDVVALGGPLDKAWNIINMDRFVVITPSVDFMNNFWDGFLTPNAAAVQAILSGKVDKVVWRVELNHHESNPDIIEAVSADRGPSPQAWENNWSIGTLYLAGASIEEWCAGNWLQLVDSEDNGNRGGPAGGFSP
jgi:filamentous hemagglutinin family protein